MRINKLLFVFIFLLLQMTSVESQMSIPEKKSIENNVETRFLQKAILDNIVNEPGSGISLSEKNKDSDTLSFFQKYSFFLSLESGLIHVSGSGGENIPGWFYGISVGVPIGREWYFIPKYCRSDTKLLSNMDMIGKGHDWMFLFGRKIIIDDFRILPSIGFGLYNEWDNKITTVQYHHRDYAINLELDAGYKIIPKTYISLSFRIWLVAYWFSGVKHLSINISREL